ncbi:MAG TPA: D-alanyl-D-alanine carboxypeptidase family protein [Baekduia sp.]|uniref:D-alanyl-D-alanine carboxypeptidase family protein n=1 Tax=Baekduia sp. TaxID=2600305 RepID=UPI002B56D80A|nr:D-alanyl-D-alanine carboxypeptidase family protein [Baekduia sp.]HMJ33206.1 D-alanyl-D-alanine carboxypeptidase family protein [Baekduia sp.]
MRRQTVVAALAAALLGAGCAGSEDRTPTSELDPGPQQPLQVANGPVAPSPATSPLTLALTGAPDPVQITFGHPPRAGLLFDLDTGRVLWRKDPTRVLPIASVTKMMTALVVVDRVPDGAKVRVTKEALHYQGSGVGVLPKNKWVGLSAMLHGLLLPSGNDAAIALAQRASGTVDHFVAQMNERATAMGLSCTRYSTPSGFTDRGNHSCAADLAVEARAVLDEPRIARVVKRRQAILPFPIKGGKLYLYNHNPLLQRRYPGTLGIKTGFTDAAGRCLVAAVRRDGHRLGVVLLHSPDPGGQAIKLFDRGFRASS